MADSSKLVENFASAISRHGGKWSTEVVWVKQPKHDTYYHAKVRVTVHDHFPNGERIDHSHTVISGRDWGRDGAYSKALLEALMLAFPELPKSEWNPEAED